MSAAMLPWGNFVLMACLAPALQEGDIGARVREEIARDKNSWTDADRAVLTERLTKVLTQPGLDKAQRERAIAAVPTLLSWFEPEVRPLLSGEWAQYNDRFPLPRDLARREADAATNAIVTIVSEGLRRPAVTEAEARKIREQLDYLFAETRRAVESRVSGEGAAGEIDVAFQISSGLAESTIGNPFYLGVDRVLSKQEIEFVLQQINLEAAKLDGMVLGPRLEREKATEESIKAEQERGARVGLLHHAVGSVGEALGLCHPRAFAAIDQLTRVQEEYKAWRKQQTDKSKSESRRDAFLDSFQERGDRSKPEQEEKQTSFSHGSQTVDEQATTPKSPEPKAPPRSPLGWKIGLGAGIVLLVALLLYRMTRR